MSRPDGSASMRATVALVAVAALLAGCAQPTPGRFSGIDLEAEDASGTVRLDLEVAGRGDELLVHARAHNDGANVRVPAQCSAARGAGLQSPMSVTVARDGRVVAVLQGPTCSDVRLTDFAPGETLRESLRWNGTQPAGDAWVPVLPGKYVVALTFDGYVGPPPDRSPGQLGRVELAVDIP